jgi:hypothetical protein
MVRGLELAGGTDNPAYVAPMVSVSPTPALDVFRSRELRGMYVHAEA